jgi:transposase
MSASITSEHISIEDRYAIIALDKHLQYNQSKIATIIKCSQGTVSNTLTRWKKYGTVEDLQRSGRPPLIDITNTNNNPIVNIIRDKRKSTSKSIQNQLVLDYSINVSYRTIRRLRQQLGFKPVHYHRRPVLTETAKRRRLNYCLDNLDEDWKNIIFTDESWFEFTDAHCKVWKRIKSPPITKPVKLHEFKVMVWGGIWWDGRTKLCFIDGTVDADKYQEIIYEYLVKPHLTEDMEVLQDGAKAHTANSTLEYVDEADITIRQNPASSPELNPIEKVWGWMKDEIDKQNPRTAAEYTALIQSVWDSIPQTTIKQFISHNSTVVCDIIQSEGGTITEPNRHHK